jgi:hypothetical protein
MTAEEFTTYQAKQSEKAMLAKKKHLRKIQQNSRRANRA